MTIHSADQPLSTVYLAAESLTRLTYADARLTLHEHAPTPAEAAAPAAKAPAKPPAKASAEPARTARPEAASTRTSEAATARSSVGPAEGAEAHVGPKLARGGHVVAKPVAPFRVGHAHSAERVTTAGETWAGRAVGPNGVPASARGMRWVGNFRRLPAASSEERVVKVDDHAAARVRSAHAAQRVQIAVTYGRGWNGAGRTERVDQRRGHAGPGRLGPGRIVGRGARAATLVRTSGRRRTASQLENNRHVRRFERWLSLKRRSTHGAAV